MKWWWAYIHTYPEPRDGKNYFKWPIKTQKYGQKIYDYLGAILIPTKTNYYIKPSFNCTTLSMSYESTKTAPGPIQLINPATNLVTTIARIEPTVARCTLGAILAPNGNSDAQIKHTICQTREYIGKIKQWKLNHKAK